VALDDLPPPSTMGEGEGINLNETMMFLLGLLGERLDSNDNDNDNDNDNASVTKYLY
jgi:hypothetical protein